MRRGVVGVLRRGGSALKLYRILVVLRIDEMGEGEHIRESKAVGKLL